MRQILEYPKQILEKTIQELKLSTILKNTTRKKCNYDEANGQKRCAIGVLIEEMYGFDYEKYYGADAQYYEDTPEYIVALRNLKHKLGEHKLNYYSIADKNDNGWSFKRIGSWLETKGL